jgi:hypothetical protein
MGPTPGAQRAWRGRAAAMSKKKNRENLAKALDESRRAEKEIIRADAQEDDELAEKIVDSLEKSPGQTVEDA